MNVTKRKNVFGDVDEDSDSNKQQQQPTRTRKKVFKPPIEEPVNDITEEEQDKDASNEDYMDFPVKETTIVDEPKDKINRSLFSDPSTSIGLSIMQKMGFKVGDSLGLTSNAIKEPILIPNRINRIGVNHEDNKYTPEKVDEMKQRFVQQSKQHVEIKEVRRIMKLCLEMSGEYEEYLKHGQLDQVSELWRPFLIELESIKQYKQNKHATSVLSIVDQVQDLHQQLSSLLEYLRITHSYCWYCGIKFTNKQDLETNCPGKFRDVHFNIN
ncbi:G patch domain-containing protein 11 [Spathaspora sp. JA1]|nr:G patch domain-containing protein 11 [Spathaspora sp. JA1]